MRSQVKVSVKGRRRDEEGREGEGCAVAVSGRMLAAAVFLLFGPFSDVFCQLRVICNHGGEIWG